MSHFSKLRCCRSSWLTCVVALMAVLPAAAFAQTVTPGTASGSAGTAVDIPINFTPGSVGVSSLRFEVALPAALAYNSTTTGAAATAAGKSASGAAISDGVRVLVFGLNNTAIGSGALAVINATIAAGTPGGSLPIVIRVLDASTGDGTPVSLIAGANGSVTVQSTGPVCGNGTVETGETCDPVSSCPTSCNDSNVCTTDTLTGSAAACTARCTFTAITVCRGGDGCCPSSCNSTNDTDCAAKCGNGVIETGETCDPSSTCPTSCNDSNSCTTDSLTGSAATCNAKCTFTTLSSCRNGDGCCPSGCNNTNDADCAVKCGNGVVETGETCDPASSCPTSCNDSNACTTDTLSGSAATCNARCSFTAITTCRGGDGCCAPGCNSTNDTDCSAKCGNGVIEAGETCDPASSCPTGCNDNNACTTDAIAGSAANCNAACAFTAITTCRSGDGCCAPGCNNINDTDCAPRCGNGIVEKGETCDPASTCPTATTCNDNNACTTDALIGSSATCTAACTHAAISACASGDGCCPSGCTNANDTDCSPTAPTCTDTDGDGYGNPTTGCTKTELDCNDSNKAIHPGALEVCNAADDDCDGQTDEGFNLQTDPANCGACGKACAGGQTCSAGACVNPPTTGLTLYPPEPGTAGITNTLRVTGATSGGYVELAYGIATGSSPIRHCSDLSYGIKTAWYLKRYARADSRGNAVFKIRFRDPTAGLTLYFQAVDLRSCKRSPVISKVIGAGKVSSDTALVMAGVLDGTIDGASLLEPDDEMDSSTTTRTWGGCGVSGGPGSDGGTLPLALILGLAWLVFRTSERRRLRQKSLATEPVRLGRTTTLLVLLSTGPMLLNCKSGNHSAEQVEGTTNALLAGDLNGDRSVTTVDLQLLVNVLLGTQTNPTIVARSDFDGNGRTDTVDLQKLVNLLLSCGGTNNACVCKVGTNPTLVDRSSTIQGVDRSTTDVQLVDVDRDGKLDVLWASQFGGGTYPAGGVDLSLNKGGGTFSNVVLGDETNLGSWTFVAPTDVNKDGFPDLVLSRPARSVTEILLLKNQRDGGFAQDTAAIPSVTGNADGFVFGRVAVADIDKDGDPDLILPVSFTSDFTTDKPNILLINDGTGRFARDTGGKLPTIAAGQDFTFCIASGDVDGDGDADLFLGEAGSRQRLLINNGSGVFADQSDNDGAGRARLPTTVMRGYQCQMADTDEDGDKDIIVVNDVASDATGNVTQAPQLFLNDGTGHFTVQALPVAPGGPYDSRGVAVGDVNGDRIPDLVVSADKYTVPHNGHAVDLFLGQCDGGYAYSAGGLPSSSKGVHGVAIGDLDGDGKADVVGAVPTASDAGSYANILLRSN